MKSKRKFAAFVVAILLMPSILTVYVASAEGLRELVGPEVLEKVSDLPTDIEDTQSEMAATSELVLDGESSGLYITLKNVPQDLVSFRIQYSFGGLSYIQGDMKIWNNAEFSTDEGELSIDEGEFSTDEGEFSTDEGEFSIDEGEFSTGEGEFSIDESGEVKLHCYELEEYPLKAFISEAANSLHIKVFYAKENGDRGELEPIKLSNNKTYDIPVTPPAFTTDFELGWFSYTVIGHFSDFRPNVAKVCSTYSWDGEEYYYKNEQWPFIWDMRNIGNEDSEAQNRLVNQEIIQYYEEPLAAFLAGERDSFYVRLEITTEEGNVYYSEPDYISRGELQPLPENLVPRVSFGFNLSVMESRNDNGNDINDDDYYAELVNYTHGEYQLTVDENATTDEIMALLPDTVPIQVCFWDKNTKKKYAIGGAPLPVKWKKLPQHIPLKAGEPFIVEDVAEPLVIPADTEVKTPLGTFTLRKALTFKSLYDSDDINLVLNPIEKEAAPKVALKAYNHDLVEVDGEYVNDYNEIRKDEPMLLAFWNKPSGAESIKAYSIVSDERKEIGELLEKREINHNQSHALYGYIDLLQPNEYPLKDYLEEKIDGFSIELEIKGGVYDDEKVMLTWPGNYDAPERIFDPYGFDGQENNAGSGFEEIAEDDDINEGQRPSLPNKEIVLPDKSEVPIQVDNAEITLQLKDSEVTPLLDGTEVAVPNLSTVTTQPKISRESRILLEGTEDPLKPQDTPQLQEKITSKDDGMSARSEPISPGAMAGIAVVGGVGTIAVIGSVATGTIQTGMIGKYLAALKNLIFK